MNLEVRILAEQLERAERLRPGEASASRLGALLRRGCALLEGAAAVGDDLELSARFDLLLLEALRLRTLNGELERLVYARADESGPLHDQLWSLKQRLEAARVAAGGGGGVTPRPEPPLTIGLGGRARRPDPLIERLLAGQEIREAIADVDESIANRVSAVVESSPSWSRWKDHGASVALALSLAELEAERSEARPSDPLTRLAPLARYVAALEQSIKVLEIRQRALEVDNRGMRLQLERLQSELQTLDTTAPERRPERPGFLERLLRPRE